MSKSILFTLCVSLMMVTPIISLNAGSISENQIITPAPSVEPRINGARIFGVRPDHPVLYKIPASGEKPMSYSVEGLPAGLQVNPESGLITGLLSEPGNYKMQVIAENSVGSARREFTIVVGEKICLTPPMGWNSWYSWSESVSDEKIRKTAEAMVSSGLVDYGWSYINIDDCWQGSRGGEFNAIQGNERFPDMKGMVDYIHNLGLKAGIYSTPWIGTYAGFIGGSSDNADGSPSGKLVPEGSRNQPGQVYGRYPSLHVKNVDRVGKYWFGDKDAKQWAQWGFDYLKLDWKPNDVPNTKRVYQELRSSGRDIVLSLSNTAPFENVEGLAQWSNLWRTTGDIHDNWHTVSSIASMQAKWQPFAGPGHWNDPDMLQVGSFGTPNTYIKEPVPSRLTADQQYSQISYWALFSAPLLLSCDLTVLDSFTIALLTNSELIDINQDPLGLHADTKVDSAKTRVLVKKLYDGSYAVGIFNKRRSTRKVKVDLTALTGLNPADSIDVWSWEPLTAKEKAGTFAVAGHGVRVVRVFP